MFAVSGKPFGRASIRALNARSIFHRGAENAIPGDRQNAGRVRDDSELLPSAPGLADKKYAFGDDALIGSGYTVSGELRI